MNLTPREKVVLAWVCEGAGTKQIAHELGVTEQAIKAHISRLFVKFGVTNRAGLATAASQVSRARRQTISDRYHERARAMGRQNTQLRGDIASLRRALIGSIKARQGEAWREAVRPDGRAQARKHAG